MIKNHNKMDTLSLSVLLLYRPKQLIIFLAYQLQFFDLHKNTECGVYMDREQ